MKHELSILFYFNLFQIKNVNLCTIAHKVVNCNISCDPSTTYTGFIVSVQNKTKNNDALELCLDPSSNNYESFQNKACQFQCNIPTDRDQSFGSCFYQTTTFWIFVVLFCLGIIGFNVTNSVSDATCFDVLGEDTMGYGAQRVWGTIGFGSAALISGICVYSQSNKMETSTAIDTITPALIIMIVFSIFDLISIKWLKLPNLTSEGDQIVSKVTDLLMQRHILIFLIFATIAGIFDSFIIYYMFWYLEEVAEQTGHMESIKLIEGCVVAAECLGGEILFFLISGKILKRIGYIHCLSFCFFMYSIRLILISMITNPWWLVLVEFFMQGCSYALCYTCIVAYASHVSEPGTMATVQGVYSTKIEIAHGNISTSLTKKYKNHIFPLFSLFLGLVAGMDDGLGFAIGSLIGGQMYKRLGGMLSFRIFAISALVTAIAHICLRTADVGKIDNIVRRQNDIANEKSKSTEQKRVELELLQPKNEIKSVIVSKP